MQTVRHIKHEMFQTKDVFEHAYWYFQSQTWNIGNVTEVNSKDRCWRKNPAKVTTKTIWIKKHWRFLRGNQKNERKEMVKCSTNKVKAGCGRQVPNSVYTWSWQCQWSKQLDYKWDRIKPNVCSSSFSNTKLTNKATKLNFKFVSYNMI